jgi:hypothetical protein
MRYFNQPGTTRVVKTESARIRGKLKRRGWVSVHSSELTGIMPPTFVKKFRGPLTTCDQVYYFSPGEAMYGLTSADDALRASGEMVEHMPGPSGRRVR